MADIFAQTNKVVLNIENIMNNRVDEALNIFREEGRIMLAEFRARQYAAPQINSPKKNKQDTKDNKSKAIAYAEAHAGGPPKFEKGKIWNNRSFRAARGVHSYIEHNKDEKFIAVGLYHMMSYGAYLEFAHNRKYAVLEPIVRSRTETIMAKIKALFEEG